MDKGITINPQRRATMIESGAWTDKLITDYLDQAVASTPDREAIVGYQVTSDTRTALTYRELNDKVTRMAAGLAAMGIGKGDLVGCPDERLGERVCAYVTLDENATGLTLDEVKNYLMKQRLSKSYLPEYLEVIESMPRTASGKIQKFKLREQAKEVRLAPAKRN